MYFFVLLSWFLSRDDIFKNAERGMIPMLWVLPIIFLAIFGIVFWCTKSWGRTVKIMGVVVLILVIIGGVVVILAYTEMRSFREHMDDEDIVFILTADGEVLLAVSVDAGYPTVYHSGGYDKTYQFLFDAAQMDIDTSQDRDIVANDFMEALNDAMQDDPLFLLTAYLNDKLSIEPEVRTLAFIKAAPVDLEPVIREVSKVST